MNDPPPLPARSDSVDEYYIIETTNGVLTLELPELRNGHTFVPIWTTKTLADQWRARYDETHHVSEILVHELTSLLTRMHDNGLNVVVSNLGGEHHVLPIESLIQLGQRTTDDYADGENVLRAVKDLFEFRNPINTLEELDEELRLLGLGQVDKLVRAGSDDLGSLSHEAAIARNYRRACKALGIPITPQESLTLAMHLRVGAEQYSGGIPLSDHTRRIAVRMCKIHLQSICRRTGLPFTKAEERRS